MFQPKQVPEKKKERKDKCRISIKKKGDGTVVKEISGECTPAQLKALSQQTDKEE